jgi:hypothetical protein
VIARIGPQPWNHRDPGSQGERDRQRKERRESRALRLRRKPPLPPHQRAHQQKIRNDEIERRVRTEPAADELNDKHQESEQTDCDHPGIRARRRPVPIRRRLDFVLNLPDKQQHYGGNEVQSNDFHRHRRARSDARRNEPSAALCSHPLKDGRHAE